MDICSYIHVYTLSYTLIGTHVMYACYAAMHTGACMCLYTLIAYNPVLACCMLHTCMHVDMHACRHSQVHTLLCATSTVHVLERWRAAGGGATLARPVFLRNLPEACSTLWWIVWNIFREPAGASACTSLRVDTVTRWHDQTRSSLSGHVYHSTLLIIVVILRQPN